MPRALKLVDAQSKPLDDFSLFWENYPKRRCKLDALKAWRQTSEVRPEIESLIAALDKQGNSHDWLKDGGQFVPLPATWLRRGQWDDE